MNFELGLKLFSLKFFILVFIALSLMPPFSFANLGIGLMGVFASSKAIEAVIKKNSSFRAWLIVSSSSLALLSLVSYVNN